MHLRLLGRYVSDAAFAFECIRLEREPLEHCVKAVDEVISFLTEAEDRVCEKSCAYNAAVKAKLCAADVSDGDFIALLRTLKYKMAVKEPEHAVELRDFCLVLSGQAEYG